MVIREMHLSDIKSVRAIAAHLGRIHIVRLFQKKYKMGADLRLILQETMDDGF